MTYRGELSGSSDRSIGMSIDHYEGEVRHTFREILYSNIVELFNLFHNQLLLVDLDHYGRVPCIASREPELAQCGFEFLGNINRAGLCPAKYHNEYE